MDHEDEVAMVRRHIRDGKRIVEGQRDLVTYLCRNGRVTVPAEELLSQFEDLQAQHEAHLARLLAKNIEFPLKRPAVNISLSSMDRADDYKVKAEEAERLATRTLSDVERTAYWRISQGWRELEAAARLSEKRGV